MPEGRTRGENSTPLSDTRGVAQHPLLLTYLFTPSTLSVRHRRRRSPPCTPPHGFTLATARASPAESGEGEKREASQSALTVPRGDTPCVTAGDARRANPWREIHSSLRHQRCRTASTFTHISLYSLNAFSATPPASESTLYPPHGFTLATARASPAVKHGAPPPEA